MAESNDYNQHARSINVEPKSLPGLNGVRYWNQFKYNQPYNVPKEDWQPIYQTLNSDQPDWNAVEEFVGWYVNDHNVWQVPRILMLERYYLGDSDIHYWTSNKKQRADNRIAGGLPRYITNFGIGYEFGNDLTFGYENANDPNDDGQDLLDQIAAFNKNSDEPFHEKNMGRNLWNTGRAYELLYVPEGTNTPKMTFIDPSQAFVVYDTTVEKCPLFAVRYYLVNVQDEWFYRVELYTDNHIYYFKAGDAPQSDWTFQSSQEHFFGEVPINEIDANDNRIGKWEPHLDKIDARDKSISEMANSQEDFNNATLVVSGDVEDTQVEHVRSDTGQLTYIDSITGELVFDEYQTDANGNEIHNKPYIKKHEHDLKSNMMVVRPTKNWDGDNNVTYFPTQVSYLTKDLNLDEWMTFINQLTSDILRETNTPDLSDDNFVGNASGVAMAYKLMGSDQERVITETLYKRGIIRRLRLIANYWNTLSSSKSKVHFNADDQSTNPANNVAVKFTPNLPKNEAEIIANIVQLCNTGAISEETKLQLIAQITGIPAEQEKERLSDEADENMQKMQQMQGGPINNNNQMNDDGDNPDATMDDAPGNDDGEDANG